MPLNPILRILTQSSPNPPLILAQGGAALWARVGALALAMIQYAMLYACGFNGASFGQVSSRQPTSGCPVSQKWLPCSPQVFLTPRHAAVLTQHVEQEDEGY